MKVNVVNVFPWCVRSEGTSSLHVEYSNHIRPDRSGRSGDGSGRIDISGLNRLSFYSVSS